MIYGRGQAPLSAYVDRGSVQIGETLRNRYVQNFQAADELQAQLDLLNSTNFEGDLKLKQALEKSTRGKLEQLATRGDYENLALAVNKANRDFQKQYSPIKQNYDNLQAYKADVQKKYEEGFIDAETYNKALAASTYGYSGLQLDAEGNVDRSSFFSGMNLVKDVNITELMNEAVKGMMPNEQIQDIQEVNGAMLVRTKEGIKEISPERVQAIYSEVINRPEVMASLNQKARLRTYNLSDDDKMQMVTQDIDNTKKEIQQLQQEMNSDKYSPQQQIALRSRVSQLQSRVNEMETIDASTADRYVNNRTIQSILDPIEQSVLAKNVYSQVEQVYEEDFNKVYMERLKSDLAEQRAIRAEQRKKEDELDTGMISLRGDSLVFATPIDFESAAQSIDQLDASIAQYDAIIQNQGQTYSEQQIKDAKAAKLRIENDRLAQTQSLAAVAKAVQAENPDLIAANTDFTNAYFYETLSDSAREAIDEKLEDEEGEFYYKRPQEVDYMTSGSKAFNEFERDFKKAFPEITESMQGYLVPETGTVDVAGVAQNMKQLELSGAKIEDVAVTMGGIGGTASDGEFIALTLSGGDNGEFDGKRVLIPMETIQSSTINDFKNSPHYTMVKRMNQARLGQQSQTQFSAEMDIRRTDADGRVFTDTRQVNVYMYPDQTGGDMVQLKYIGADGTEVTTPLQTIDNLINDPRYGLGTSDILSFRM